MASNACVQKTGREDFPFLGNRSDCEPCRHGVAVLEPYGLYAEGQAGHPYSATKFQIRILGKKLSEQRVVGRGRELPHPT